MAGYNEGLAQGVYVTDTDICTEEMYWQQSSLQHWDFGISDLQ